ncbi:B12 binding domain protein [Planctomycetes bacterium Pla163]|uniref:B12 binding domain protein n=1 Tax=Rohdeia mirabilis TaxID=2528008 RepID=A0A518CW63_9BACT|nr:B12 binding domain protein [Planctomycetes bacterium Pla163]
MTDSDPKTSDADRGDLPSAGDAPSGWFSVGRVASETGISAETLRVWERRYGRPVATRLPSGHRRYTGDQVVWLRRVAEAVALGTRASVAVRASESELDELLTRDEPEVDEAWVEQSLRYVLALDSVGLARTLLDGRDDLDVVTWLRLRVGMVVREVGSRWAAGELDIRHEHLATQCVSHVLRREADRFTPDPTAPLLLLTTLSGEQHALGLWMVELVALQSGWRTASIGTDTPADQIAKAAIDLGARAVGVSVSLSTGGVETHKRLGELRGLLTDGIDLVVGGEGARSGRRVPRDVHVIPGLRDASRWFAARS